MQNRRSQLDEVIDLILPMKSRRAEVFATVHAAWNNLVLDGCGTTDKAIHKAASEDWHPGKKTISESEFQSAMSLIRGRGYVPDGSTKRVAEGQGRLF